MSFFDNENKEFNTKNILPIIGATIGVVLTLGAAGVALSPLLSMKIAGYAAGFVSPLGLTTLGAGLVFGAIFAIVAAVSIRQMFANNAKVKAQANINAQAEDIKKVEASIEAQAQDIKKVEASVEAKAKEALEGAITEANIPAKAKEKLEAAIAEANIPDQVKTAITEQNLVTQTALTNATQDLVPQAGFKELEVIVKKNEAELINKADKSALVGLAPQADLVKLEERVKGHDTALGEKLDKDKLSPGIMTLLNDVDGEVTQHLGSKYAPKSPNVSNPS